MMRSQSPAILPSPARLGGGAASASPSLPPNPNPNPNPSSKPSSQPPHQHPPSAATSAALLPLLPPLPRAQTLLLQMAALAARLFDVSPNRSLWLAAFRGSLPSFLPSSSAAVPPPALPAAASAKDVLSLFTSLQTQLFQAVAELQEILDLQDNRVRLAREARASDGALLAFAGKLHNAEQLLDRLVDDYADYRPLAKRFKPDSGPGPGSSYSLRSSFDLTELLAYAHRISYTTFAPPEHGAGLAPLRGALPPAPQDNEMRASQLYHFADLDVGVPKKAPEATERAAADSIAEHLIEPTPPREELRAPPPPPPPPMLPISVPPGWRKGMRVELPMDLPPVPPGWKPGDPIPLPPLDALGGKTEEQRMPMLPLPVTQPKAPEAIQVKYVQLDINPDQDDYSSEYSSDVGSSEEDDEE